MENKSAVYSGTDLETKRPLTEFDRAVHAQQDVVALDVPMDDLVGVKELQGLKTLNRK